MYNLFTLKVTLILFFIISCGCIVKAQNTIPAKDTTKVILVVTPGQTSPSNTVAPANAPPKNYSAPNLSERSGSATYMLPSAPKKTTTQPAMSTTTPASAPVKSNSTPSNPTVTTTTVTTTSLNGVPVKNDTSIVKKDTIIASDDSNMGGNTKIIYAEIGGPGLALTLNYDARISGRVNGLGFMAGAGYYADGYGNSVTTVPLQVNYLIGKGPHFLELGVGTTFLNSYGSNKGKTFIFDRVTGFIGTATIGYRFQSPDKRLNFRVCFVPILYDEGLTADGGLSVGYTFK